MRLRINTLAGMGHNLISRNELCYIIQCHMNYSNTLLSVMVSYYPSIEGYLSQAGTCCVCGEPYINSWLECVQFKAPKQVQCTL